jgi:lipopolysaccharide/colanic/teichoic acid biosynthesis glycosyltransferase
MNQSFYSRIGKRWLDATGAFAGLIGLSPLFIATALAIKLTNRGPVFFRQVRVGRFCKPFRILKFRTMTTTGEGNGPLLTAAGDSRITPLGRLLRKMKADELPQLINVLAGEMSLVGPRPEVPEFTAAYSGAQKKVFLVRPGITGPAANDYVHEEELLASKLDKESFYVSTILPAKLEMDLSYCENVRFFEDLKIIFATLANVFLRAAELAKPMLSATGNRAETDLPE